jgi:hypothetical protein
VLHPDEIKHILDELLFVVDEWDTYNKQYIEYKKNYNRVMTISMTAAANTTVDGGGNNEAIEDESGPVGKNTFPIMENGECAIVRKAKGGNNRTIKRIKLRRVTRSRPIHIVKKQRSRTRRHSDTKKKARR